MNFFEKLNIFSKYLNDWFYINNNTIKQVPAYGGYHKSDFDLLTAREVLQDLPIDTYLAAKFHSCPTEEDNTFILELLQNEYSNIRSDNMIRNENLAKFATTLIAVKSMLSGDQIFVDIEDMGDFIIRDDFAANGKVHTIYSKLYKITLN